jgi:hypothetical protein
MSAGTIKRFEEKGLVEQIEKLLAELRYPQEQGGTVFCSSMFRIPDL